MPFLAVVHSAVPSAELMRGLETTFAQIDWPQVVIGVVGVNPTMYQKAFEARMKEILERYMRDKYAMEEESGKPTIAMKGTEKPDEYMETIMTKLEAKDMEATGTEFGNSGRVQKEEGGPCPCGDDSLSFVGIEEKLESGYDGDDEESNNKFDR